MLIACRDEAFYLPAQPQDNDAHGQGFAVHGQTHGRPDLQAATLDLIADDQVRA